MPDAYEHWLVPTVFRPFAVDLARRVAERSPTRVLELAAGTGVLTRELVAGGSVDVVATDLNLSMVALGRGRAPGASWREADAMDLPFGDGEFDVVVCQFGAMFFPDKPAAFREARRVLAPAGALVLNTWAHLATHDFQAALVGALEMAFPADPPTFIGSIPHGYADRDAVVADLAAARFGPIAADTVTLVGRAASAADVAAGYCLGTPLRAEIESRGDIDAILRTIVDGMEARLGAGPVTGRMTAHVIVASVAT